MCKSLSHSTMRSSTSYLFTCSMWDEFRMTLTILICFIFNLLHMWLLYQRLENDTGIYLCESLSVRNNATFFFCFCICMPFHHIFIFALYMHIYEKDASFDNFLFILWNKNYKFGAYSYAWMINITSQCSHDHL